jgi:hypothetical protein
VVKREAERKAFDDKKHAEELSFLQHHQSHLNAQLMQIHQSMRKDK